MLCCTVVIHYVTLYYILLWYDLLYAFVVFVVMFCYSYVCYIRSIAFYALSHAFMLYVMFCFILCYVLNSSVLEARASRLCDWLTRECRHFCSEDHKGSSGRVTAPQTLEQRGDPGTLEKRGFRFRVIHQCWFLPSLYSHLESIWTLLL